MPIPKITRLAPAVNISKPVYSMASGDGERAEIVLYGDIYETRPVDMTGEPAEGEFILLDEFMKDLERVSGCREITVRLNSYGGDAGVSVTIHNRLRELARGGAKLTCVVDGVAMSGGSIIMCACDKVLVNPASLIMIHKCWSFLFGNYNADELKGLAAQQDAWDKAQASAYRRKTGLSESELLRMMSDTATMTGREALEKGFADGILEDAEPLDIAASADGRALYVRGRRYRLAPGLFAPDAIPTVYSEGGKPPVETNTNSPDDDAGNEEEEENSMTLEELREKHPDIVAQIEADARAAATAGVQGTTTDAVDNSAQTATQAERARIQGIDEIAGAIDPALVHEAKYGATACSAEELALRAVKAAAKSGQTFLASMAKDANASGAANVGAAPGEDPNAAKKEAPKTPQAKLEAARALIKSLDKEEK